jgi:hypothetical protein
MTLGQVSDNDRVARVSDPRLSPLIERRYRVHRHSILQFSNAPNKQSMSAKVEGLKSPTELAGVIPGGNS